jgi:hypothetical protein
VPLIGIGLGHHVDVATHGAAVFGGEDDLGDIHCFDREFTGNEFLQVALKRVLLPCFWISGFQA